VEAPEGGAEPRQLKQSISLFQAIMYGTGLILGAGIYVLIGDAAGIAGNAVWISFIVAAVLATFTGLSYAELSSTFPKSAAEYVFTKNAFGSNFVAFIVGCMIVFVALVSAATVALGFSGYLSVFFPQVPPMIYAVALVGILSFVNFYGITESVWTNVAFTVIELAGLAAIMFAGFVLGSPGDVDFLETPASSSSQLVLGAAGLIFFAYFGFENMANLAEETKNASRVVPRALLASIAITTVVYILVAVSALELVGWQGLASSDAPLAAAAGKALGSNGTLMLSVIALFATSNTVLIMLVSGSRIIFGIARDGAFPAKLAGIHPSRQTPWIAVMIAMVVTIVAVAASSGSIESVANVAVFSIFIVYGFVNLSLIWLRYSKPDLKRPFRSPANVGRFPVLAGLGLVTSIAMLFQFPIQTAVAGLSVMAASALLYKIKKGR
jgi:APA family basic amino acid/polyamine antiporter